MCFNRTLATIPGVTQKSRLLMARSHCTEGGQGTGMGSTVHIAAGSGQGMGPENIVHGCLHVLETALLNPCACVLAILK